MGRTGQVVDVIYHGDCLKILKAIPDATVDLVATDPPFGIGLKYDVYNDKVDYTKYLSWCEKWLTECVRILKPTGSIFVCIGDEYAAEMNVLMKQVGFQWRNWIIWAYTFGQNQRKKYSRCHTHIHYFVKNADDFVFNADDIRIPSARQVKYKDKRANPLGTVPPDVWNDDVWDDIPRLCGTYFERIKKEDGSVHPCQLPQSIVARMIKATTNIGDIVVDPFCGTGTTAATAKETGRKFITCDLSENYCKVAASRVFNDENAFSVLQL